MLDAFALLRAMGGIREEYLLEAQDFLGYREEVPLHRGRRKLLSFVLVAAVLVTLFSVTAYALGWFGLRQRVIPAQAPPAGVAAQEEAQPSGGWMAANGYAGSPETKASMEWEQVYWAQGQSAVDGNSRDWLADMGEYAGAAMIYGAYDRQMLDELLTIQEKYGLRLHSDMVSPINDKQFFAVTGIAPFLRAQEDTIDWQGHYIFEDGSFKGEGSAKLGGKTLQYFLNRSMSGVLAPYGMYIRDVDAFEEWQYEKDGHTLALALRETEYGAEGFIFYYGGECFITIGFSNRDGEGLDREDAEQLAALFDYAALCGGEADLSARRTPAEASPREGLLTLSDYLQTPEYQAGSAFQQAYGDYFDARHSDSEFYVSGQYMRYYYAPFPTGEKELDGLLARLQEQYPLRYPSGARAIRFNRWFPAERMIGLLDYRCAPDEDRESLPLGPAEDGEYWELLGVEPFLYEGGLVTAVCWDNGVWQCCVSYGSLSYELCYVPKGSFCPVLRAQLHPEAEGWAYETACGAQVYITLDGGMEYPRFPTPVVLYETETAYVILGVSGMADAGSMQAFADDVDFTKFQ